LETTTETSLRQVTAC